MYMYTLCTCTLCIRYFHLHVYVQFVISKLQRTYLRLVVHVHLYVLHIHLFLQCRSCKSYTLYMYILYN